MKKIILLISLLFSTTSFSQDRNAAHPLPIFDEIKENVQFWQQVYSRYTTREFIFHDADRLMRVYGIKSIPAGMNPWSRQAQRLAKFEKENYREILMKFSHGMVPANEDETRIYSLFPAGTDPKAFREAADNIRTQLGQADRFREGIVRSGLYMNHIKQVFRANGLPDDLVYLPHVESSFDYKAYSKTGAAGMWQFMRSTGRLYMKVNYLLDERRDPVISTVAAAKLLSGNFRELQSWPLAITAYNHGLAGMQRAVRKLGTRHYPTIFSEHEGRRFGFASRNFYSEFLAAREVASNYQRYFGDLNLQKPLQYEEINIDKPVDLNALIAHFEVDRAVFENLNLAFRPPLYRRGRNLQAGYPIRLPKKADADYAALLASFVSKPPTAIASNEAVGKDQEWVQVQPGDSLWSISQQLQVSADAIRDLNELEGNRILVGQILKIPSGVAVPKQRATVATAAVEKPVIANDQPEMAMKPQMVAMDYSSIREQKALALSQDWDALMNVPVSKVADQEKPQVGIPVVKEWHGTLAVRDVQGQGEKMVGRVTLEAEETLGHFAEWLQLPTQTLRRLNHLAYDDQVQIGKTLKVSLAKVTAQDLEEKRMEFHQSLQEDFYNNYRIDGVAEYQVKRGDTIWKLSKDEFDLPIWLIRDYNPQRDVFNLQPGDTISYPVAVPKSGA